MRNRFTIDTDIVFDGEPERDPERDPASPQEKDSNRPQREEEQDQQQQQQQSELAGDTDRWVEEQFDLEEYEDPEEVKETDILSDDDEELCRTPRAMSSEADLEASVTALSLDGDETEGDEDLKSPTEDPKSPTVSETGDSLKQSPALQDQKQTEGEKEEIWVRRERRDRSSDCDT